MRTLLAAIVLGCWIGACGGSQTADSNVRVDPSRIERIENPADQARIGPPEVVEPATDAPNGIALRIDLDVGAAFHRRITGTVELKPDEKSAPEGVVAIARTKLDVAYSIEAIAKRGDVTTVKVSTDPITVTGESNASKTQAEVFELKVDSRGRIVENLEGLVKSAVATAFVPFPVKKVAAGSAWSVESLYTAPVIGEVDLSQTYTFRGIESRAGRDCWRVDTVGVGGSVYRVDGTYWFDAKSGVLMDADWTATAKTSLEDASGAPIPSSVTMKASLRPKI